MNTKLIILLSFLICPFISGLSQEKKSEVVILGTIHGAHKTNPHFTYDSLFHFIENFNPDIIGVEIRQEDIDSSFAYLKNNYPYEMYACIQKYPSKKVLGFDWLGPDLMGKAIPENYWKENSAIKKLQHQLSTDSILLQKLSILNSIKEQKNKLVLNASLAEFNNGRYDLINHIYYEQLEALYKDTAYEDLTDFYKERDEHISRNLLKIISENSGKRMLFLIGADHRDYTLKKVSDAFGTQISLNNYLYTAGTKK